MFKTSVAALSALALTGCAGLYTLTSDVASYSHWPAGRQPASYAFERLPSQQARVAQQERLEALARPALASAGFSPAAAGQPADVRVQLGVRVTRTGYADWDEPYWWGGWGSAGFLPTRFARRHFYGGGFGIYGGYHYEREVGLLIRDARSGQPLYETRASTDARTYGDETVFGAMFEAAMKDFPHTAVNPRRVSVQLPR